MGKPSCREYYCDSNERIRDVGLFFFKNSKIGEHFADQGQKKQVRVGNHCRNRAEELAMNMRKDVERGAGICAAHFRLEYVHVDEYESPERDQMEDCTAKKKSCTSRSNN